jgi:hypothetical protein
MHKYQINFVYKVALHYMQEYKDIIQCSKIIHKSFFWAFHISEILISKYCRFSFVATTLVKNKGIIMCGDINFLTISIFYVCIMKSIKQYILRGCSFAITDKTDL